MKRLRILFAVLAFVICGPTLPKKGWAQASEEAIKSANTLSLAFEQVADQITPSVVNISAIKKAKNPQGRSQLNDPFFEHFKEFFGDDFMERFGQPQGPEGYSQQGLGTGVIVDKEGHILTNNHVVGEADEVLVRLHNDQRVKAKIVGVDPRTDLAVIKIKADNLSSAQLGNSDDLKIGEWVVAAGNPFGLDNTITAGIVSAKGRSLMGGGQYEDFIQTDAAINPGNSGGPLVNLRGQVVGINTAIFSRSGGYMGIGFAIPINMAKDVMQSLIQRGKVVRGWLGVGIQDLTEELARSFNYTDTTGALVGHVEKDGPADKAGLKQGDIIISMDGDKIKNINQLRNAVAAVEPGKKVKLELIRNGRKESAEVKVGELPAQAEAETKEEEESPSIDLGISIDTVTPELGRRLGLKAESGVIVKSVEPGSTAARAGILPRDIIVSLDSERIDSVGDFNKALAKADLKKGIRMVVQTGNMERFVFLKAAEDE